MPTRNKTSLTGPSKPTIKFVEHAKSDGLLPHEFLIAVMRCRYVEMGGRRYRPTAEQRRQAAAHLAAALCGGDTQTDPDDS